MTVNALCEKISEGASPVTVGVFDADMSHCRSTVGGTGREKAEGEASLHACCCCPFSRLVNKLRLTFEWSVCAFVCVCVGETEPPDR